MPTHVKRIYELFQLHQISKERSVWAKKGRFVEETYRRMEPMDFEKGILQTFADACFPIVRVARFGIFLERLEI
jgi:hypothetical protein